MKIGVCGLMETIAPNKFLGVPTEEASCSSLCTLVFFTIRLTLRV